MFALRRSICRYRQWSRLLSSSASSTDAPSSSSPATDSTDIADMGDFDVASMFVSTLTDETAKSFPRMLRESKLMQLGDFDGRIVIGNIVHVMADDLYIDFGGKFDAVCKVPKSFPERYVVGQSVLLRLHDMELSERFLGAKLDLTLLEADATLIRIYGGGGVGNVLDKVREVHVKSPRTPQEQMVKSDPRTPEEQPVKSDQQPPQPPNYN